MASAAFGAAMIAAPAISASEPVRIDSQTLAAEHRIYNAEAVVPPQCYTRTFGKFNPCYTCHQTYAGFERPNYMDDGFLQGDYNFSDTALTNHWTNLFVDRSAEVGAINDEAILTYIAEDNYSDLRDRIQARGWQAICRIWRTCNSVPSRSATSASPRTVAAGLPSITSRCPAPSGRPTALPTMS